MATVTCLDPIHLLVDIIQIVVYDMPIIINLNNPSNMVIIPLHLLRHNPQWWRNRNRTTDMRSWCDLDQTHLSQAWKIHMMILRLITTMDMVALVPVITMVQVGTAVVAFPPMHLFSFQNSWMAINSNNPQILKTVANASAQDIVQHRQWTDLFLRILALLLYRIEAVQVHRYIPGNPRLRRSIPVRYLKTRE
jgi:hypothetical protein